MPDWSRWVTEHAPDMLVAVDHDWTVRFVSDACESVFGYEPDAWVGSSVLLLPIHPDDMEYAAGALTETGRVVGFHSPVQLRIRDAHGVYRPVEIQARTVGLEGVTLAARMVHDRTYLPERRLAIQRIVQDISNRCAAAEPDDRDRVIVESLAQIGAFLNADIALLASLDHNRNMALVDDVWAAAGVAAAARVRHVIPLPDLQWDAQMGPVDGYLFVEDLAAAGPSPERDRLLSLGVGAVLEIAVFGVGAPSAFLGFRWCNFGGEWDDAHAGNMRVLAEVLAATVRRLRAEQRLRHQALHDPLTGLANRVRLWQELDATEDHPVALLFCDLDRFKPINDRYGHEVGDRALAKVGEHLAVVIRENDLVARVGGDEFVVLCGTTRDPAALDALAERLRNAVRGITEVNGCPIQLDLSVGWVVREPGEQPEDLLHRADRAMYDTKQDRRAIPPQFSR